MFVTVSHFPKGLVFLVSARSLPLEWSQVRGSTQVGSYLGNKFWTRVEVTDSAKCSSLIHNDSKRFYSIVPCMMNLSTKISLNGIMQFFPIFVDCRGRNKNVNK